MRSQKRSHTERAFSRGYQAGIKGRSKSLCPHSVGQARSEWLNGWREARNDDWNGFGAKAQAQKLSNL